jgi:hypothetical protein
MRYKKDSLWACMVWLSLLGGLSVGCNYNNPPIPAYVYVESINFVQRDPAREGSASQKITDAWLSVDGQLLGVKETPMLVPVILSDNGGNPNTISVRSGIDDNAQSSAKIDYSMLTRYVETRYLKPGQVDTIRAITRYDTSVTIILVDDFESTGGAFGTEIDGDTATKMVKVSGAEAFEGQYSGRLLVDTPHLTVEVANNILFSNLQTLAQASPVYIEFNYKTDVAIEVGLIAHYSNGATRTFYKGGVNPRTGWSKAYFNLTNEVFAAAASSYTVVFKVANYSRLPSPKAYIDNVKLLHF